MGIYVTQLRGGSSQFTKWFINMANMFTKKGFVPLPNVLKWLLKNGGPTNYLLYNWDGSSFSTPLGLPQNSWETLDRRSWRKSLVEMASFPLPAFGTWALKFVPPGPPVEVWEKILKT